MADAVDVLEIAVGHVLTAITPNGETLGLGDARPAGDAIGATRYSCSCGEIEGVGTDAAQAHAEDVTP